jgi:hypothetical protein
MVENNQKKYRKGDHINICHLGKGTLNLLALQEWWPYFILGGKSSQVIRDYKSLTSVRLGQWY